MDWTTYSGVLPALPLPFLGIEEKEKLIVATGFWVVISRGPRHHRHPYGRRSQRITFRCIMHLLGGL